MRVFIGGVRGGGPVTGPAFAKYGGDTTSFLIEGQAGERMIVDAGSGLNHVWNELETGSPDVRALCLLFSHYHLDHMMGLPAFKPLYEEGWTLEFAARIFDELTVEDVAHSFVNPPFWPLALEDMASRRRFRILDDESMESPSMYGGLQMTWCPLHHPGGSTAYRIEEPATGQAVVIATDVEWGESDDNEKEWLRKLCSTPSSASLLIFDGKYADAEYAAVRGWGHSTWQEGVALAQATGIPRLLITHLDEAMDDDAAARRDAEISAASESARLARQGEWIDFAGNSL